MLGKTIDVLNSEVDGRLIPYDAISNGSSWLHSSISVR